MPKLRLHQAPAERDERAEPNPYRFPVEAARQLGSATGVADAGARRGERRDVITEIEQALDRMQTRLDDLSGQIESLPFPGGDDEGPDRPTPSAA